MLSPIGTDSNEIEFWRHVGETSRHFYGDRMDVGRLLWHFTGPLLQTHVGWTAVYGQRSLVCGRCYCFMSLDVCTRWGKRNATLVDCSTIGFYLPSLGHWRSLLLSSSLSSWEDGRPYLWLAILTQSSESSPLCWLSFNHLWLTSDLIRRLRDVTFSTGHIGWLANLPTLLAVNIIARKTVQFSVIFHVYFSFSVNSEMSSCMHFFGRRSGQGCHSVLGYVASSYVHSRSRTRPPHFDGTFFFKS